MKKWLFALLAAALLQGCCKADCINAALDVSFENFKAKDTDSVQVIRYPKGSRQSIDSTWLLSAAPPNDTLSHSAVFITLFPDKDWEIRIAALNKSYSFTDFETQRAKCQCGGGRTTRLIHYKMNGTVQTGYWVRLE